ncbi:hypothetical protein BGC_19960 [Burkholderia sp. 3C]
MACSRLAASQMFADRTLCRPQTPSNHSLVNFLKLAQVVIVAPAMTYWVVADKRYIARQAPPKVGSRPDAVVWNGLRL